MRFIGKYWKAVIVICALMAMVYQPAFAKKRTKHLIPYQNKSYVLHGEQNLQQEINRVVAANDPNATIGIYIKSMKYGDTLYTRNEQRLFIPASILKVFTAESALTFLGSTYKFTTKFVADSKTINHGVLEGNLYLIHSGDPTLTDEDLADLVKTLRSQHISQISGNVYIDNSAYDLDHYGPGWAWDDKRFCYAAPISASIINHNCQTFRITPSKNPGRIVSVTDNPTYAPIQNSVITKAKPSRSCYVRLGRGENDMLVISGCMAKGTYSQSVSTVVTDIVQYNKNLLRNLLARQGISVRGTITTKEAPSGAMVLASHESKPLPQLLVEMLKMSDNIIAGSLFKKIGELYTRQPGSWTNGSQAVKQILNGQLGVDTYRMNITDGSGLSRYNLITPAQMMRVLDFAFHHYANHHEFIAALPVAGIDGTLKHRLRNVAWKVRAKTGTISGVVALAGYATNHDNEPLAFVIIVNGRNGLGWKYRDIEDKIVTAMTRYTRRA